MPQQLYVLQRWNADQTLTTWQFDRGAASGSRYTKFDLERQIEATTGDGRIIIGMAGQSRPQDGLSTYWAAFNDTLAKLGVSSVGMRRNYDSSWNLNFNTGNNTVDAVGTNWIHHSFKLTLAQLQALQAGSGAAYNAVSADLKTFLDSIPANAYVVLTIIHEPEDNFTSTADKLSYRQGCAEAYRQIKAHSGYKTGRWRTCHVFMSWTFATNSGRNPSDWNPGSDVVDILGIDDYPEGGLSGTRYDSPGLGFGEPEAGESTSSKGGWAHGTIFQWMLANGYKYYGVAEFGVIRNFNNNSPSGWSLPGGFTNSKADQIINIIRWHYNRNVTTTDGIRCVFMEYFNYNGRNYSGTNWSQSTAANHVRPAWNIATSYAKGAIVAYSAREMKALVANTGHTPVPFSDTTYWEDTGPSTESWELQWDPADYVGLANAITSYGRTDLYLPAGV